jgi:serine phosphatase RsbU (regulator of sigma subunit)
LIALFFYMLVAFQPLLGAMNLRTSWHPFGVLIPLELLASCGQLVCFSFVLFRQFRNSLLRQKSIEEDMKQAQEIQRLLVPEQLPRLRRWRIESEYRPARQVGGDFFQIIPSPIDESILIVAGDVAGKGLQAGMLVALLVGAIRTESEHTFDPVDILKALNSRLLGRNEAQATCLALRINEDGAALLANAGHLPPYLNGVEVSMEGALPLGTIDDCEFPVTEFHLQPGDRLVLFSDGIVEAQNERGDLFGFDRVRIMLAEEISTAGMARAAQDFGQEDDISVLSIIRNPAMLEATV